MNICCYIYKFLIEYIFPFTRFFMLNTWLNKIFIFHFIRLKLENKNGKYFYLEAWAFHLFLNIFYVPQARKLVFPLQLRVTECCVFPYRGIQCSQDWSPLGFVSALPQLRLGYALASISYEHCRSSRNNPHCVSRYVIYYSVIWG